MKITMEWKEFEVCNIPERVRKDIVTAIAWMREDIRGEFNEELYATRMINIHLTGVNRGINMANAQHRKLIEQLERGGK